MQAHWPRHPWSVHVWRSASKSGDTKTPKSKRSPILPKRAVAALKGHKARQDRERLEAGTAWHENDLVFCHEDGDPYTSDQLNWRFSKMTRRAGIGPSTLTKAGTPPCRS
jgi:hypothetical protein